MRLLPDRSTLVTLAAWLVAALVGVSLSSSGTELAPWWPATGVAVVGLRLGDRRQWPILLLLLALLAAVGATVRGDDVETVVAFGLVTPVQAWVGATVLDRLNGDRAWWLDRHLVTNLVVAGLAAGAVGGILGTLIVREDIQPITFALGWLGADMLGLLTVVPMAEALLRHDGRMDPPRVVASVVFGLPVLHVAIDLLFVQSFDLVALAAVAPAALVISATRTGPQTTSLGMVAMAATSMAMAATGQGVLLDGDSLANIVQTSVVLGALSTLALVTAATSFERDRAAAEREQSSRELYSAIERERAAAERLRELDTLRDTFVRAISHDLRTPLAPLLGLSNLLATRIDRLDEKQVVALAQRIWHNGQRVQRLLDDLDDLNRLGVGIDEGSRATDDAAAVVRDAVDAASDEDHPVTLDLDSPRVVVDAITLRRITHNLVANAMRHTPRGTPVRVSLRGGVGANGADGAGIVLVVEDDGGGVPDDHKERIFSDFTQGPGLHTSGSGVGLALVREFARMRGGRAHVEDAPSGGARFVVSLPAQPHGDASGTAITPQATPVRSSEPGAES